MNNDQTNDRKIVDRWNGREIFFSFSKAIRKDNELRLQSGKRLQQIVTVICFMINVFEFSNATNKLWNDKEKETFREKANIQFLSINI